MAAGQCWIGAGLTRGDQQSQAVDQQIHGVSGEAGRQRLLCWLRNLLKS